MTTLPEPSTNPPAAETTSNPMQRVLTRVWIAAIISMLLVCLLAFMIYQATGRDLMRELLQYFALLWGTVLIAEALLNQINVPVRRALGGVTGLLLLIGFADSLDGIQHILPMVSFEHWYSWLLLNTVAVDLWTKSRVAAWWKRLLLGVSIICAAGYLGAASYYTIRNLLLGPLPDPSTISAFPGLLLSFVLRLLGGVLAEEKPLSGRVRICPSCGLRNIPERRSCKRCQTELGEAEWVR